MSYILVLRKISEKIMKNMFLVLLEITWLSWFTINPK